MQTVLGKPSFDSRPSSRNRPSTLALPRAKTQIRKAKKDNRNIFDRISGKHKFYWRVNKQLWKLCWKISHLKQTVMPSLHKHLCKFSVSPWKLSNLFLVKPVPWTEADKLEAFSSSLILFRNSLPNHELNVRQIAEVGFKLLFWWPHFGSYFD